MGARKTEGGAWITDEETLLEILSEEEGRQVGVEELHATPIIQIPDETQVKILSSGRIEDTRFN